MNHSEVSYRKHWAVLTGKSESEIYVPLALREPLTFEEGELKVLNSVQVSLDQRG